MTDERVFQGSLRIRRLRGEESGPASALIRSGLREHWGELDPGLNRDLEDLFSAYSSGYFAVAHQDGALVGTGGFLPVSETEMQIHRMSVDVDRRGAGIGAAILGHLLSTAQGYGYRSAILETTETWTAARRFYERHGFEAFDRRAGDVYLRRPIRSSTEAARSTRR